MAYSIKPLNNSINKLDPSKEAVLEYEILGSPTEIGAISKCKVDLTNLADLSDWEDVRGSLGLSKVDKSTPGIMEFTGIIETIVSFRIENVQLKESAKKSGEAIITIRLEKQRGQVRLLDTLNIQVFIRNKTPKIEYFTIYPSIIRSQGDVELSWKCTGIDRYGIQYDDGTPVTQNRLNQINNEGTVVGSIADIKSYEKIKNNESFHLEAKLGDNMVATENNVRSVKIMESGAWQQTSLVFSKNNEFKESTIVNLILNERNSDRHHQIWALARNKNGVVVIWCSFDGLNWLPYRDNSGDRVIVPPEMTDCPILHFNNKLYFIGGSKVDIGQVSNKIARYSFSKNRWLDETSAPWLPRMGHSCVVFPDADKNDKIWVIGGADKNGNGLNDIQCWNGTEWKPGPVSNDFPRRCLFSAIVRTNKDKQKELWIAGGTDSYNGSTLADIWKYSSENWGKIERSHGIELSLGDNIWIKASALTNIDNEIFVTVMDDSENSDKNKWLINDQGTYRFDAGHTRNNFVVWGGSRGTNYNYALLTRGFNGCIWLMAKEYITEGKIDNSSLYYSVK